MHVIYIGLMGCKNNFLADFYGFLKSTLSLFGDVIIGDVTDRTRTVSHYTKTVLINVNIQQG